MQTIVCGVYFSTVEEGLSFAMSRGSFRLWIRFRSYVHELQVRFRGETWRGLTLWVRRFQFHVSLVNQASIHSAKAVSTEKA